MPFTRGPLTFTYVSDWPIYADYYGNGEVTVSLSNYLVSDSAVSQNWYWAATINSQHQNNVVRAVLAVILHQQPTIRRIWYSRAVNLSGLGDTQDIFNLKVHQSPFSSSAFRLFTPLSVAHLTSGITLEFNPCAFGVFQQVEVNCASALAPTAMFPWPPQTN